jgi:predicted dehydrogenase
VFREKPITSTVDDAEKTVEASMRGKGILKIGHICNSAPASPRRRSPPTADDIQNESIL